MSLRDQALYTLVFVPSGDRMVKLVENATISYDGDERYVRVLEGKAGEEYSSALYDPLSGARLASTGFVEEKIRSRRLELHGPDEHISFDYTGRLGFEWTMIHEGNKYKWKRSGSSLSKDLACIMKRGGDPDVEICLYRPGNGGDRRSQLQLLHYNIERFLNSEIKDIRGLETLLCMTAIALEDANNIKAGRKSGILNAPVPVQAPSPAPPAKRPQPSSAGHGAVHAPARVPVNPPPPPPKEPELSPTMVAMLQEEDDGEVLVGVDTDIESHVLRANRLLFDENVLFIIIRSRQPEAAMRATEVSLGVQRYRHRNMLPELHRYMVEEEEPQPKGPRVIKLDDPPVKPQWKPPPRLAIYLSRIELPDLAPKKKPAPKAPTTPTSSTSPAPMAQPSAAKTQSSQKPPALPVNRPGPSHNGHHGGVPPRVPSPAGRPHGAPPPPDHDSRFSFLRPSWR